MSALKARVAGGVMLGLLAFAAWVTFEVVRVRKSAAAFLRDVRALEVGRSSFREVQDVARKYAPLSDPASTCTAQKCAFEFAFENTWLRRLRLAPETYFRCTLSVRDGRLVYRHVGMTVATSELAFSGVTSEETERRVPYYSNSTEYINGLPGNTIVRLRPDAGTDQRLRAYDFNVSCLAKLGGCKRSAEILPRVWRADVEPLVK